MATGYKIPPRTQSLGNAPVRHNRCGVPAGLAIRVGPVTIVPVARRTHAFAELPLEFIDDGLTDTARESAMVARLEELDRLPAVEIAVRATDTLAEARGEGEV